MLVRITGKHKKTKLTFKVRIPSYSSFTNEYQQILDTQDKHKLSQANKIRSHGKEIFGQSGNIKTHAKI